MQDPPPCSHSRSSSSSSYRVRVRASTCSSAASSRVSGHVLIAFYLLSHFPSPPPHTHTAVESQGYEVGGRQLFSVVLCRKQCSEDKSWRQRPDGKAWDTVKPLASNGLPLGRVFLVDNELRKAAPGETANMLLLPTWEECAGVVWCVVRTWRTYRACMWCTLFGVCAVRRPSKPHVPGSLNPAEHMLSPCKPVRQTPFEWKYVHVATNPMIFAVYPQPHDVAGHRPRCGGLAAAGGLPL